jgi:hypothetical protein
MSNNTLGWPTVMVLMAITGAAAFAAGRSTRPAADEPRAQAQAVTPEPPAPRDEPGAGTLPPGHPPTNGATAPMNSAPSAGATSPLSWTAPARWKSAPNPNSMRIATYKIPRAAGDTEDAELSVTQAGGSIDQNIERWVDQFGPEAKKNTVRESRKVGAYETTFVSIQGTYAGGMGGGASLSNWALAGAIVATPDMPHFFKLTGPEKTVKAARAELEALVASLKTK